MAAPVFEERGAGDFFDWETLKLSKLKYIGGKTCPNWVVWWKVSRRRMPQRAAGWKLTGWHGTTWYNAAAIARDGRLKPGSSEPKAVYVHKHATVDKAIGYGIFQGIGQGVMVLPMFEVALQNEPSTIRGDQWYILPEQLAEIELRSLRIAVIRADRVPENAAWAYPGEYNAKFEA